MAIKVQCPECHHEMSLKTFKPGRFKPTCTQCKSVFQLVIGPGDSPEIKTARLATPKPEVQSPATSAATIESPAPVQTTQPGRASSTGSQSLTEHPTEHPAKHQAKHPKEQAQAHVPSLASAPSGSSTTSSSSATTATIVHESGSSSSGSSSSGQPSEQTVEHVTESVAATGHRSTAFSVNSHDPAGQAAQPATDTEATIALAAGATAVASHPAASTSTRQEHQTPRPSTMPERLGGYRILKELGRGGMGAVYLAKQLSLDRNVAVKTIQNDWSANPRAVARFIREAYAAAQLTHHNVVQIYDLGQDQGVNFFSMELVEGGSLDDMLKRQGRLNPKQAATFVLHAARGLRFAHDHGMIHRDIKPANLMLTTDSLVKVADLGLVKTPAYNDEEQTRSDEDANLLLASARSQVTGAGSTLGTPAYMAPEQAEDATTVDHRADIYSLGCTFYALLVGKPPYANRSAVEILSKIKTEPIARVDSVIKDVPPELASIVAKMTAKAPGDRYQIINEVIQDLERFLESGSAEPRQRADKLQQLANELQRVPTAKLRNWVPLGLAGMLAVGILLGLLFSLKFSLFCAMCLVLTPVLTTLLGGLVGERSPVTQRCRALVLQSSFSDWITFSLGSLAMLVLLWLFGLIGWAIAALVVSAGLAAAVTFGITTLHRKQTQPIVDQAKEVVRDMRLQGVEEDKIAGFIREFAGKHWEGLLEALFGYEAMRAQRQVTTPATGRKSGSWLPSWRDLLVDRLDARLNSQREAREQRILAKVESASLQAAGVGKKEAEEQASAMATSLVSVASQTRQLSEQAGPSGKIDPAAKRERIKQMLATARTGKPQTKMARASRATGQLLNQLIGGKLRFAIGTLLLIGCGMWANQNQLFDKSKLQQVSSTLQASAQDLSKKTANLETGQAMASQVGQQMSNVIGQTKPLEFPIVGSYFTSFAPGIIGLLILLSAFVGTWRLTIPALIAAGATLLAPQLGLPGLGLPGGAAWLGCAVGIVVLMLPVAIKPLR